MATREQKVSAIAERIADNAGLGGRIVVLLLEQAVREGFDLAVEEISGSES